MVLLIGLEPIRILLRGILRLLQGTITTIYGVFIIYKTHYIVYEKALPQISPRDFFSVLCKYCILMHKR